MVRLGETLFGVGGVMMIIGLVLARFPRLYGWFGKLPGDIMTSNVIAPVASMLVLSLMVSAVSMVLSLLLRLIRS